MPNRFSHEYVTPRDGGLRYQYDTVWWVDGAALVWEASVHRNNEWKGTPSGILRAPTDGTGPQVVICEQVEHAIEALLQVTK